MSKPVWHRIDDDSRTYAPGTDSPENHYILETAITGCLQEFFWHVAPEQESLVPDMRRLFIYGPNRQVGLPRELIEGVVWHKWVLNALYHETWGRYPYQEELAVIFDKANEAR